MPYIPNERRIPASMDPSGPGELAYAVTRLVMDYVRKHGLNYATLAHVYGVLDLVGKETYRRVMAQYEDRKRELNGEVYPVWAVQQPSGAESTVQPAP
jgi:hypothetical protein